MTLFFFFQIASLLQDSLSWHAQPPALCVIWGSTGSIRRGWGQLYFEKNGTVPAYSSVVQATWVE